MRGKLITKCPLDPEPWPRDSRATVLSGSVLPGTYVYVRDASGLIYVCPDPLAGHGSHLHPKVLGYGQPVSGAGAITIGENATIERLDNYSVTFRFGPDILKSILDQALKQGMAKSENTRIISWTKHF